MMRISDLTAYAAEKYRITEEHKWNDFPGYSVLVTPSTGKWAALLIRRPDPVSGEEAEYCDIKCGMDTLIGLSAPWLSQPFRMKGSKWVGVRFCPETDPGVVRRLFDRAVRSGEQQGYTFVFEAPRPQSGDYHETPLPIRRKIIPFPESRDESIPEKIREMLDLYDYGDDSFRQKCRNFAVQGKFMQNYEDDAPWNGTFLHYFPTYHDLSVRQLRGYFTWRTKLRAGDFRPISASLAYIYLYELLNGIGAETVEERLAKMKAFEEGYLDTGKGDANMRRNLRRWMLELCIVNGLPEETALQYADEKEVKENISLSILREPKEHGSEEIFEALAFFIGTRLLNSPVLKKDEAGGKRLFAEVWKFTSENYHNGRKSLFTSCFGSQRSYSWYPFGNAVFYDHRAPKITEYQLFPSLRYDYKDGEWRERSYHRLSFDPDLLSGLFHEADRRLRLYLKTGSALKERPEEQWAAPFIEAVIEADRRAKIEAAKPKVTIRFDDLARIRRDAIETRDSLLTEEDLRETPVSAPPKPAPAPESSLPEEEPPAEESMTVPLDRDQIEVLQILLEGRSVRPLIAARHGMPTVIADGINEALFGEIGDSVVESDGEDIVLIEDYRDDIIRIMGGK